MKDGLHGTSIRHPLFSSVWPPYTFQSSKLDFQCGRAWDSQTSQKRISVAAALDNLTGTWGHTGTEASDTPLPCVLLLAKKRKIQTRNCVIVDSAQLTTDSNLNAPLAAKGVAWSLSMVLTG